MAWTFPYRLPDGALAALRDRLAPRSKLALFAMIACAVVGGLVGWLLVPSRPSLGPDPDPPRVTLGGKPVLLTGDPSATLESMRAAARAYAGEPIKVTYPGGSRDLSRDELGARVDPSRLAALARQLRDPSSALRRHHEVSASARGKVRHIELPMPVGTDDRKATFALLQLKDELDRQPVNARYDYNQKKVIPDEPGLRMDVFATLARVDAALQKGEAEVALVAESLPAPRPTKDVVGLSFDEVLGYFETKYARDLKHEARTFNLKLAASKLDGHVVFPGEVFDFNDVVGPRTEAMGYKVATVIAQGELVDGIGGGTCQIAGTLHGAAFFAGLDVAERKPHTRPSFYIKMGMDATVVYPTITLKLKNPFDFPVVLHEKVEGGTVRAEILGPRRSRDVTFVRKVNEVTPFQEKEVEDPKVPKGERVLAQRGIPGFRITRYRIVRDGSFAVREKTQDQYPPVTQIWRVGSGDPSPKFEPHDDEHPEYVADEYLMLSQGPSVRKEGASLENGGPTVESRVAGKYGSYGWTVKMGFTRAFKRDKGGRVHEDDRPGTD